MKLVQMLTNFLAYFLQITGNILEVMKLIIVVFLFLYLEGIAIQFLGSDLQ